MSTFGIKCAFYRGTAGTEAATLVPNIKDVELNLEYEQVDATTRESGEWGAKENTIKNASIATTVKWKKGDPHFEAFRDAYMSNTAISVLVMDGPKDVVGNQGFDADCKVSKFNVKQMIKDIVWVDLALEPAPSTRSPQWKEIEA
jgi:hypothetical protein